MFRKFVAETYTILVQAEGYCKYACNCRCFFEMNFQFTIAVADCFPLTPRLRPAFVEIAHFLTGNGKAAVNFDGVGQKETKLGRRKYRLSIARHGIGRTTITIE